MVPMRVNLVRCNCIPRNLDCGQSIAAKITQVPAKNAELNWSKSIPFFDSIISMEELKYEIRDFLGDQAICHDLPHTVWLLQF